MRSEVDAGAGDRKESWRRSYLEGRKDPLVGQERTNRRRLRAMGVEGRLTGAWLDLGAGDGNVAALLEQMGARPVVAVEYQPELLACAGGLAGRVLGDVRNLPVGDGAMDGALVMDVLHHVAHEDLSTCLRELRRVLRPGGLLLVCEPAPTVVRRVLQVALMSPLSGLTAFSRDKRTMVELEADTLVPWLDAEHRFVGRAAACGFSLQRTARRPLHTLRTFRSG